MQNRRDRLRRRLRRSALAAVAGSMAVALLLGVAFVLGATPAKQAAADGAQQAGGAYSTQHLKIKNRGVGGSGFLQVGYLSGSSTPNEDEAAERSWTIEPVDPAGKWPDLVGIVRVIDEASGQCLVLNWEDPRRTNSNVAQDHPDWQADQIRIPTAAANAEHRYEPGYYNTSLGTCQDPSRNDWFTITPHSDDPTSGKDQGFYLRVANKPITNGDGGVNEPCLAQNSWFTSTPNKSHYASLLANCWTASNDDKLVWDITNDTSGSAAWNQLLDWAIQYQASDSNLCGSGGGGNNCKAIAPDGTTLYSFSDEDWAKYLTVPGVAVVTEEQDVGCLAADGEAPTTVTQGGSNTDPAKGNFSYKTTNQHQTSLVSSGGMTLGGGLEEDTDVGIPFIFFENIKAKFDVSGTWNVSRGTVDTNGTEKTLEADYQVDYRMVGQLRQQQQLFQLKVPVMFGTADFHQWRGPTQVTNLTASADQNGELKQELGWDYNYSQKSCDGTVYQRPTSTSRPQLTQTDADVLAQPMVGDTVTATPGEWAVPNDGGPALTNTFYYQWKRTPLTPISTSCTEGPIIGADQPTYTIQESDVGCQISVDVANIAGESRRDSTTRESEQVVGGGGAPITLAPQLAAATDAALPNGAVGRDYQGKVQVTAGRASSIDVTGDFPDGLSIAADGSITGTPTQSGTFTFQLTPKGGANSVTGDPTTYTIVIDSAVALNVIRSGEIHVGSAFTWQYQIPGASGVTYSLAAKDGGDVSLPNGVSFDDSKGTLSGTPTESGTWTFRVTGTTESEATASRDETLTVTDGGGSSPSTTSVWAGDVLPQATTGQQYSTSLVADGASLPDGADVRLADGGSLPNGLTLSADGTVSGTPTSEGAYSIPVELWQNGAKSDEFTFLLTVGTPVKHTEFASQLVAGQVGQPLVDNTVTQAGDSMKLSQPQPATQGTKALPDGVSFDTATGKLHGTPTEAGSFTFTVTDTGSDPQVSKTLTLVVKHKPAQLVERSAISKSTQFTQLTAQVVTDPATGTATAGVRPDSATQQLLDYLGLTFDAATGTLSGAPLRSGTFPLKFEEDADQPSYSEEYTVDVVGRPAFTVSDGGTAYFALDSDVWLEALYSLPQGDTIEWSGTLPEGLRFDGSQIVGRTQQAGDFPVTVTAHPSDEHRAEGATDESVTFTVHTGKHALPDAVVGQAYDSATLGLNAQALEYAQQGLLTIELATGSQLPAGLTLDAKTGHVSGTPTAAGDFAFTVVPKGTFADGDPLHERAPFTIHVASAAGEGGNDGAGAGADAGSGSTVGDVSDSGTAAAGALARTGADAPWLWIALALGLVGAGLAAVGLRRLAVRRSNR